MKPLSIPLLLLLIVNLKITTIKSEGINEVFKGLSCTDGKESECTIGGLTELGCCSQLWEDAKSCEQNDENTKKCEDDGDFHCVNVSGWTQTHRTDFDLSNDPKNRVPRKYKIGDAITECRLADFTAPQLDKIQLRDRSTLSLLPKTLLGRPCSPELYKFHKIREMWEHYLKCPFDTLDVPDELSPLVPLYKIVSLSYYDHSIFERVCLASSELLECQYDSKENTTAHCECLQFPQMTANGFKFNQTSHGGKVCGQIEGFPCTHNIMPDALTNNNCVIKTPVGQVRPQILNCEPDAACDNLLQPKKLCPVTEMCKCQCVERHQCNPITGTNTTSSVGTRTVSKHPFHISLFILIAPFLIGFSIKSPS